MSFQTAVSSANSILQELLRLTAMEVSVKSQLSTAYGKLFVSHEGQLLSQFHPKFDKGQLQLKVHNYYNQWRVDDQPCSLINDPMNSYSVPRVEKN